MRRDNYYPRAEKDIFSGCLWRVIDTGIHNPYMNMAIDEALAAGGQDGPPVFRFYDWLSPSISIGYGQRVNQVIDRQLCVADNIPVVRRPTGGGVVFHGIDITYSVVLQPGMAADIYDAYKKVQSRIQRAFAQMGVAIKLYSNIEKHDLSGFCFISPNFGDLMVRGKKLGGMAARRKGGKILCQGYIYADDAAVFTRYCRVGCSLNEKAVSLRVIGLKREKVKEQITASWAEDITAGGLNDEEKARAEYLYESKYNQDKWNYRR